ncbi:hypothetical protein ACO0K0_16875 [Undibacterium sp. SXout11W]|uniref:hypothetical protein n=1 Tax=Undibacterium sp. SXout11W TaxID=3413050 RepID=UPI003BF3143D
MIFAWFDARECKKFGQELADFYLERVVIDKKDKTTKFVEKKQKILLSKIQQKVFQFKAAQSLNVYKKAQIGNVFKWRLIEAGFDKDYVDELTSWLMRNF